jgi:hypothetical protein
MAGAFERRHRLMLAAGFYDWRKADHWPFRFTLSWPESFAFAGLWDAWKDPLNGTWIQSFAIITTAANELIEPVNDRMPAVIEPDEHDRWSDRSNAEPASSSVMGWSAPIPTGAHYIQATAEGDRYEEAHRRSHGIWHRHWEEHLSRCRSRQFRQASVVQHVSTRSIARPLREHACSTYRCGELSRITVAGTQASGIGPHGQDHPCSVRKTLCQVQQERYGRYSSDRGGRHQTDDALCTSNRSRALDKLCIAFAIDT